MSKVAIKGNASGTATFTIEAPVGVGTDRTLVLPDEAGTVLTSASGAELSGADFTGDVTTTGNLCVGTTSTDSSIVNVERTDYTKYGLKIEQTSGTVNFTIAELLRLKLNGTNAETPFQRFFGNTTELGEIRINGTSNGTQYLTTSDYRLKENVVDMTDSVTRLKQLRPVNYNFIGNDVTTDGFLAHEVKEIVPSAVSGQKDAVKEDGSIRPQMIEMSSMIPLLTGALQEAIAKIETLETTVADLQTRVTALEATP